MYVNSHGTGTKENDKTECAALKEIFGERTKSIPMSSIKSMLGHTFGAAAALEMVVCVLILKTDLLPPTINYQDYDPECDIDCIPNKPREKNVNSLLNMASAFGGNNSCVLLRKINSRKII